MNRLFNILTCIIKAKKIIHVKKKKFVIFDCVNSDVLSKILPKHQTHIVSARSEKIDILLINFKTIFFILKNIFYRTIQLNYFISLIKQIEPKYVLTTIDNSINFSILTKYFENKIKFIAIQNATRGEFYENDYSRNKSFYFTNYIGMSNFDLDLMKRKNIKIKNFYAYGSLRNSFFLNNILTKINTKKKYQICLVGKNIFKNEAKVINYSSKTIFKLIKFLALYVKKYKKNIVIQSKAKDNNKIEKKFYEKEFAGCKYKINWSDKENYNSYKTISSSNLIIGAPSTLLREAFIYPNTKVICFNSEKKKFKYPFPYNFYIKDMSFKKFEKILNFYFAIKNKDYQKKVNTKINYVMSNKNTVKCFLNLLKEKII